MNLRMNCLGYHWSAVTYGYDKVRDVDGLEAAPIPDWLNEVALRALRTASYWPEDSLRPFDICIANLYAETTGKLGVHKDDSESQEALDSGYPVVSVSIGASAIFTIGGLTRQEPQIPHVLASGDVVIFGRSKRLAYHGVTKLVKGSTPPELQMQPGRLNLTFRVI